MEKLLITIGAITTASRFARLLERKAGVNAAVTQTPSALNKGGCSYSVKIKRADLESARRISAEYKIPMRKIYATDGGEYHAIT